MKPLTQCKNVIINKPRIFIEFKNINNNIIGTIVIELYREICPNGIDNIIEIIKKSTQKKIRVKDSDSFFYKKREFTNSKVYEMIYNNVISFGDIYNNDGSSGATIYDDKPVCIPEYEELLHDDIGVVSLIPYIEENLNYVDSNLSITLSKPNNTNNIKDLNGKYIVIGKVIRGIDILERINNMINPFAKRKYPEIIIGETGLYEPYKKTGRIRPIKK